VRRWPAALNLLDNKLAAARQRSARLLAALSGERALNDGHLIGVTGPPGAGKSSLVSALIREWRLAGRTVGVLAVDPSSRPELGGGALLGDRIRIKNASYDEGLFIRSLANRNQLGGVASEVWPMSWLLLACFDIVVDRDGWRRANGNRYCRDWRHGLLCGAAGLG
jgi:LAO/AO transport system kinase